MSLMSKLATKPMTPARRLVFFLLMMLAHVGLPLLAWGPTDVGGFFANPARAGFIALTFLLLALMAMIVRPEMLSKGADGKLVRERSLAFYRVFLLATVISSPYCDRHDIWMLSSGEAIRYIGLVLAIVGGALGAWVPLYMGRQFSGYVTIQEGHRLITDGPFRWIRHPRYLGIVLYTIGMPLVYDSAIGLVFASGCAVVLAVRIGIEERMLEREFASQWVDYRRRTKRLVPLVW